MKCIKLILSIVLFAVTLTLSAQDTALTYPATYVETVLDAATLQALSHTFSVDKVRRHADNTFDTRISLSYKEFDAFRALGIPYTVAPRSRAYVQMAQNYDEMTSTWRRYPTYSTYLAMMDTFRTRYPSLCEIDTILYETPAHHRILCAHISNNLSDHEGKPSVFYTSTIHGDEVVGYYMMLRLIDYLLANYNTDSRVTELVDQVDLWICPLHNPDGTYYTSNNQINESPVSIRYNRHYEDLNRSFPHAGQPAKSDYEPEVEAMMTFMAAHNFTLAANFHGGAEVFNYPWDTWTTWQHSHADAAWWEYVGHRFADTCQHYNSSYMNEEDDGVTPGGDWYVIEGSMQDYHNWYLGTRHVTIEVSDDKVLSTNYLPSYWGYIRSSLLNFIDDSRHGIHGTVTDSITGEPLEALVYIANHDLDHSYVESVLPHGDYHRPIKAGQYSVTYSADGYLPKTIVTQVADGQTVLQNVQLCKTVGMEDYESCIALFPNPAKDFVTVEISGDLGIANIALYDVNGRMVRTNPYSPLQSGNVKLDVHGLYTGTYILHLKTADGREIIRKIAKQ